MSAREPLNFSKMKLSEIPDVQSQIDYRNLRIDDVGVKGVRYPLTINSGGKPMPTIATLALTGMALTLAVPLSATRVSA